MNLKLTREPSTNGATLGSLYVDDIFFCYTLEDVVRDKKIPGETAIPPGIYKVLVTWSPRFKRQLPLLIDVPGFDGIRIHPGNTDKDTDGCILVGMEKQGNTILRSREAFNSLYDKIVKSSSCSIEIK